MRKCRQIMVGSVAVGGGAPVSVQTMANVDPHDVTSLVAQAERCSSLGCEIFRMTIPDVESANVLGKVKAALRSDGCCMPIVSDIHFDYRCALAAIENGTDALRLNPGNIGSRDKIHAVASAALAKRIPIRVGVNLGSLETALGEQVESGTLGVPEALCRSALAHEKILRDEGFYDVVISAKASNVVDTLATYRILAERTDSPLHLGVTEAGTFLPGTVRNAVAIGVLLDEGIGDTIRVSLTDQPEKEVRVGMEILRAFGMKPAGPAVTSCPTCGRTKVNLREVAESIEQALESFAGAKEVGKLPKVAVMGCVVNGPGEAKAADIALCGGDGCFVLYADGKPVEKVSEADACGKVVEYVMEYVRR